MFHCPEADRRHESKRAANYARGSNDPVPGLSTGRTDNRYRDRRGCLPGGLTRNQAINALASLAFNFHRRSAWRPRFGR